MDKEYLISQPEAHVGEEHAAAGTDDDARPDDRCGDSFLLGSHNELFGLNLAARIRSKKIRASQLRVILCDDSAVAVTKQVIHDEGTEIYDAFRFCFLGCVQNILRPFTVEARCTSQPPSIAAPT